MASKRVASILKKLDRRPVRYILIGGWNTVLGYALFAGLYAVCVRLSIHYMAALILSTIIGVVQAYFLYKHWVFKTHHSSWLEFFRFCTVYAFQFAGNLFLLPLTVSFFHLSPLAAQAIVIPILAAISYLGHHTISFRLNSVSSELEKI